MASTRVFYLLVVDDDSLIHQSFRLCLPPHWKAFSATSAAEIPEGRSFHAAFVDLHLSGPHQPDGLDVLKTLHQEQPLAELIAMSGDLRRDLMEATLKAGAQRFLAKPLQSEELLLILEKIEALWDLRNNNSRREGPRWIGDSTASKKVLARIASLKGENGPLLIEGESGCGKEVAARLLHGQEEAERPFVPVNIAGLPEHLFEAELFGHVKGAFTGADRDRMGLCEAADGGDLFLDEIEALPAAQQVKLLRFLESGEIRRVGGDKPIRVHCRVIAASNRPLTELVKNGSFREDLYFRLSGKSVHLPPLRERPDDIGTLAAHFLESERPRRNKSFTQDGLDALKTYTWPGNVRELKRLCEQLSLVSPLPLLRAEDVQQLVGAATLKVSTRGSNDLTPGLTALVEDYEKSLIRQALQQASDVEQAAALLKISRSNLYKKIKDYQLETES